jgi:hypothetical protein
MKLAISDDLLINCWPCLLLIFCETGENSYRFIQKITDNLSKDPRKPRNEFSLVRKQELDFSGIFSYFSAFFRDFIGFLIHSIVFIRELMSIFRSMYDVKMINKTRNNEKNE